MSYTPLLAQVARQGAMDAGNLLKPMLARGELRCIGATTLMSTVYIEKMLLGTSISAGIAQPTVETTISILRGLKQRYEVHHSVKITDSALVAAVLPIATSPIASCQIKQLTWWMRQRSAENGNYL